MGAGGEVVRVAGRLWAAPVLGAIAASPGLARPGSPVGSVAALVTTFDPGRMPVEPWRFDPDTLDVTT